VQLYNVINKRLPGWQDPPSSKEIRVRLALLGSHLPPSTMHVPTSPWVTIAKDHGLLHAQKAMDVFGAGGMLDEEQFILFAHDLVKSGPGICPKDNFPRDACIRTELDGLGLHACVKQICTVLRPGAAKVPASSACAC
jgi:hypothetical protein